jgi:hypothetical protein
MGPVGTSPVRFSSRPLPNAACAFQRTTLSGERYNASPCCPPLAHASLAGGELVGYALVRRSWTCPVFCLTQTACPGPPRLACTPSPHVRARLVRFAPAVRPAPGVLRVLRRHSPFVRLAPRRRSRVPTQLTSEDGLGVPFESLRLFTTAQPSRSASGQDTKIVLAAGRSKEDLLPLGGGAGVVSAVSGPCPFTVRTLGFNRCRLRRAIRASTDRCLGGFGSFGLLASMLPSPRGFPVG